MTDHSVTKIVGIGPVTAKALEVHGIKTVGQLAEVEAGEISINNSATLIHRAREYVKAYNNCDKKEDDKVEVVVLGKKPNKLGELFSTKLKKTDVPLVTAVPITDKSVTSSVSGVATTVTTATTENKEKLEGENKEEEESKFLIQDHSWWEMKVLIPRATSKDEDDFVLKEAIIYELSVEPHNRISFVCSWVCNTGNKDKKEEKLCTMTYSPQLIFYFNLGLPPLEVSIRQDDYKLLPNHEVLTNLLWETNIMHKFSTSDNVEM